MNKIEKTNLKILFKSLRKYNLSKEKFNIYKIDDLIFNRNKRFVSIFKDYLFINDDTEFLFLFYSKKLSEIYIKNYLKNNDKYPNKNFINSKINTFIRLNYQKKININVSVFNKKYNNYNISNSINIKKLLDEEEELSLKKKEEFKKDEEIIETLELNYDLNNEIINKKNNEDNSFSFISIDEDLNHKKTESQIKTIKVYKYKNEKPISNNLISNNSKKALTKEKKNHLIRNPVSIIGINQNKNNKLKKSNSNSKIKNNINNSQINIFKSSNLINNKKINKYFTDIKNHLLDLKSGINYKNYIINDNNSKTISSRKTKKSKNLSTIDTSSYYSKSIKKNLVESFIQTNRIEKKKKNENKNKSKDKKIKEIKHLSNKNSQNDLNSKHLFSTINNRRKYNNIEELFFSPQVLFDKVKNKQFKKNMIQKKNYYTSSFIYSIPKLLSPSYDVYNNIKSSKNNTLKKKVYNIFPFQLLNKESSDLNTTRDNTKKKIIKSKIQKKML